MAYALATHTPAANTDAVATFAAVPGVVHELDSVYWCYSATPTGGTLTIESPSGTVLFTIPVTSATPGSYVFRNGVRGAKGQALVARLKAGTGSVVGTINAITR